MLYLVHVADFRVDSGSFFTDGLVPLAEEKGVRTGKICRPVNDRSQE